RRPHHAAGAPAGVEGGPGGDALVGRDAVRLPRRGRDRVYVEATPALEAAGAVEGQIRRAEGGRAVAAEGDGVAAEADVPRPDGQLGQRGRYAGEVDRRGALAGVDPQDRVLRL